ncbi:hypothetical protein CD56_00010 [Campylobacter lari]|nr:hypothetical protein CD56_00010 [Campylobacter lari]
MLIFIFTSFVFLNLFYHNNKQCENVKCFLKVFFYRNFTYRIKFFVFHFYSQGAFYFCQNFIS